MHYKYFRLGSAITLQTTEDRISCFTGGLSHVYILPLPTNLFILAMFAQALLDKYKALSCKHFYSSQNTFSWHLSICWIRPLIYNECQATSSVFQWNISREPYLWWSILEIIFQLVFQAYPVPILAEVQNKMGRKGGNPLFNTKYSESLIEPCTVSKLSRALLRPWFNPNQCIMQRHCS